MICLQAMHTSLYLERRDQALYALQLGRYVRVRGRRGCRGGGSGGSGGRPATGTRNGSSTADAFMSLDEFSVVHERPIVHFHASRGY